MLIKYHSNHKLLWLVYFCLYFFEVNICDVTNYPASDFYVYFDTSLMGITYHINQLCITTSVCVIIYVYIKEDISNKIQWFIVKNFIY